MWKALIKLVESWAFRCEHDWEQLTPHDIYSSNYRPGDNDVPIMTKIVHRCTKCGKHTIIKI